MGISFISNSAALNSQSNIAAASNKASASIARLSSGNRIQKASDDVSGLAIGTALRSQVNTLRTALNNAAQGTSLLQVADGGLSQIVDILQRQKSIAVQASSGQVTDANRALLNQEFTALTAEIDRIAASTNFNGVGLLSGGLGTSTATVNTSALAVTVGTAATATSSGQTAAQGSAVASTNAVQAFNIRSGATLAGTAAAGQVQFVDSAGTALVDAAFLGINTAVSGQFDDFKFSNIIYGAGAAGSATLTATINGVEFKGTVTGGTTTATLQNGSTYIKVSYSASVATFTNAGTAALAQTQIGQDFRDTVIQRTMVVNGVDFNGTRLQGAVGTAAVGGVMALRISASDAVINNFAYVGNGGAADTSILSVQVNGQTFTARNVEDAISNANARITFLSEDNQMLYLDLTGLTDAFTATLNIRTSLDERAKFINALNQAVGNVGAGLSFSIGSAATDTIKVSLTSASTVSLYNGASLNVSSAANAAVASAALDNAITQAVSLRSTVGALQSRFNFASNAVQVALENQDAARGSLLDTDVSAESSEYASAQVQLQAGISVLAQANQLPQALLKLLG